jgi:hypothetical protein
MWHKKGPERIEESIVLRRERITANSSWVDTHTKKRVAMTGVAANPAAKTAAQRIAELIM